MYSLYTLHHELETVDPCCPHHRSQIQGLHFRRVFLGLRQDWGFQVRLILPLALTGVWRTRVRMTLFTGVHTLHGLPQVDLRRASLATMFQNKHIIFTCPANSWLGMDTIWHFMWAQMVRLHNDTVTQIPVLSQQVPRHFFVEKKVTMIFCLPTHHAETWH